jgi:transposase
MITATTVLEGSTAESLRKGVLSAEQAAAIYAQGQEAVIFALLELTKQLAEARQTSGQAVTPSTPSGMIPVYEKPSAQGRRKRPGAKPGHPGARRRVPERIDRRVTHRLACCPQCGGRLHRTGRTRTRWTEDIPDRPASITTEHTIHRDWCPRCRRQVEPRVPDALPGATLGCRTLAFSAWLHYGLGNTLSQILEVFNHYLQLKLSKGGLVEMWQRLAEALRPWYDQIGREALDSAVLHADETGWRESGKTRWLWCFGNASLTYYMIDKKRGSPALRKFFQQEFAGTLVSDFWGAYNSVVCGSRQTCLVHLLRDLEQVEQYQRPGPAWAPFAKKLRRLVRDAIRLGGRAERDSAAFASRRARLHARLAELVETPWNDSQARRLVKRLRRHRTDLFTFLDHPDVPFDNNHAERAIRPAVIIRKNSYCNRSPRGAETQAMLMSIYRTLKQRGHDPLSVITQALMTWVTTNQLPHLPAKCTSNG